MICTPKVRHFLGCISLPSLILLCDILTKKRNILFPNEPYHIRISEYFTFAKQIFHREAISLALRANFTEDRFGDKAILQGTPYGYPRRREAPRLCRS